MSIKFTSIDPGGHDHDALVDFMVRNEFPFHGRPRLTRENVETSIGQGAYQDENNESFWIDHSTLGGRRATIASTGT